MATVGGVTHRLRWLDRNVGWRMGCSCGWADTKSRLSERRAVEAGNRHIRSAQTAARRARMTPAQLQTQRWLTGIVAIAIAIGVSIYIWNRTHHTAYQDGRNWAMRWEAGPLGPEPWVGCNRTDMVSSGYVNTPQAGVFNKRVYGANDPHDNYAKWRAGCESAKAYYKQQLKSGG